MKPQIFSNSVEIACSCAVADASLSDTTSWAAWRKNFVSVSEIQNGTVESGSTWIETRSTNGVAVEYDVNVTDYIRCESMSLIVKTRNARDHGMAGRGSAFLEYRLVDFDRFTALHLDTKLDVSHLNMPLLKKPFLASYISYSMTDILALKKHLESLT